MKIGILTFHRAENFGAVLQAYALSRYLTSFNNEVEIIDYRCPQIDITYHIFNPRVLFKNRYFIFALKYTYKIYLNRFHKIRSRYEKKNKYKEFRWKFLRLSKKTAYTKMPKYDAYIVGSDQVWNFGLIGGLNKMYFLDLNLPITSKKLTYAASSENNSCKLMLSQNKDFMKRVLNKFDGLSVREVELKKTINQLTEKDIYVNIDPVFLLPKEEYNKLAITPEETNYILVYHIFESTTASHLAKIISMNTNRRVVEIHADFNGPNSQNHKYNLGPLELLGYIANADVIITTSFHGLAFSLIFEKEFWVINKGYNGRLVNLLKSVELSDRMIDDVSSYDVNSSINFSKVRKYINSEITSTYNYFNTILNFD